MRSLQVRIISLSVNSGMGPLFRPSTASVMYLFSWTLNAGEPTVCGVTL